VITVQGETNDLFANVENSDEAVIEKNTLDMKEQQRNVTVSLAKSFDGSFLLAALMKLMKLVQDLLKFLIPQISYCLITSVKESNSGSDCGTSSWVGYFCAISIFLSE
jgi:hypothetical protein